MTYVIKIAKGEVWLIDENGPRKVKTNLRPHQIRKLAKLCEDYNGESSVMVEAEEARRIGLIK